MVTVADEPLDEVDFPPPAPAPAAGVGTVVTVAGNGIPGLAGDGRPATAARLFNAFGIAVDRNGDLSIADADANRVRKVDGRTSLISTVAGSTPFEHLPGLYVLQYIGGFGGDGEQATAAQLNHPEEVAVDGTGNLYISDYSNHRVRKLDPNGIITTVAGNGQYGFSGDGQAATKAQLAFPAGLAVDQAGNLFVIDSRRRVRKVGPNGIITTFAGGGKAKVTDGAAATAVALLNPLELAVDAAGDLFIGDSGLHQILKVTPAGIVSIVAGTGQVAFSHDGGPAKKTPIEGRLAMAVDSAGNLFFADMNRIRKIGPDGIVTTVAGNGQAGFTGDGGPATAARLTGPTSLAIDAAGNLLFTDGQPGAPGDQSVKRVRKVIGIAAPGLVGGQ
jgi:hypothetical protein